MKKALRLIISLLKNVKVDWEKMEKRGDRTFQLGWRLAVLGIILTAVVFIFRGLRDDGFSIQPFAMPKYMVESGFTGEVMARKLVDELRDVDSFVSSVKEETLNDIQNLSEKPDLDVEVMGIGLTINAITYHLRELLGRPNRAIGGEVTDVDQTLSLTLRITGQPAQHFNFKYEEGKRTEALQSLIHEAAKSVIDILDPYRLAVYHYRNDDQEAALQTIEHVLEDKPEDAEWAYIAWGNLLSREGKLEEAILKFERASQINPKLEIPLKNWAWLEFRQRDYDEAAALFRRAIKLSKEKGQAWNNLAYCLRTKGNFEEADKAYAKAIAKEPQNQNWYINWASSKIEEGDTAQAAVIYEKMFDKVELEGAPLYFAYAQYYHATGKRDSVVSQLETVLDLEPNQFWATRWLMNLYSNRDSFQRVTELAPRLIELAPTQNQTEEKYVRQSAYNEWSYAEYSMGRFESAKVHAKKAIEMAPEMGYPYTTLAEIYGLTGKMDSFYFHFEEALMRGIEMEDYLKFPPYNELKDETRFQELVQKYKKQENLTAKKD